MMPSSKSATKPSPDYELPEPVWQWAFEAIGTHWWTGLYDQIPADAAALQRKIAQLIDEYDDTFSRFRTGSLVERMATRAGIYKLPPYAKPLLDLYRRLYDLSDGQVTPLIGQLLADAGYDAQYSLQPKEQLSEVPKWDDVMHWDGENQLQIKQPVLLDFGAAGKGHLIDLVSDLLKTEGFDAVCVDAGGDMIARGIDTPLRIGLENPQNFDEVIGVADVQNAALCGSAPNRRAWGKYHHVMNPRELASTNTLTAVRVMADSALIADGLTTALFFVEPDTLREHFDFSYAYVASDGSLRYSQDLPAEFFT